MASRKTGDSNSDLTDDASTSAEALESSMDSAVVGGAQADVSAEDGNTSEDEENDDDESDDENTPTTATDPDDSQTEDDEDGSDQDKEDEESEDDDDFVEPNKGAVKLRLREILFYDDKVAVFKARHGRL